MISQEQLLSLMPKVGTNAGIWASALSMAAERFLIGAGTPLAMWLANIAHESMELTVLEESFNYKRADRLMSIFPREIKTLPDAVALITMGQAAIANRVYMGRMGNVSPGDGWKFRGRGPLQLTGRTEYRAASIGIAADEALLVTNPDLVAQPVYGGETAAWYWQRFNLNACTSFLDVCEMINFGSVNGKVPEGMNSRQAYYDKAKGIFA